MSYHLALMTAVHQLLYDQFLTTFDRNDDNVAWNKDIISADLENVGQVHCLQNSLYHGYYMTDLKENNK